MISQIRTTATILACTLMALIGSAQPTDRALTPKARVLDFLFTVEVTQRPYLFKLALRFYDAGTQVVIVVYPDKEKYWVRRCEVTTYSLDGGVRRELAESLSKLPPEASDDAVRAIVSRLKVQAKRVAIAPEALAKPLSELRSIKISPMLPMYASLDEVSRYEFWYNTWQDSVHYSMFGPPGKAQGELVRWMIRLKTELPDLLKGSSAPTP